MIIISNHLFSVPGFVFPKDHVVRLNLAWMKDLKDAENTLSKIKNAVYLDYPQGRSKPPKPAISLKDAINLANKYKHVKYFAVSNVEEPVEVAKIRKMLPKRIDFIPKIETKRGIKNLAGIMKYGNSTYAMLDKEDLYLDVQKDSDIFEILISTARLYAKEHGFTILELQGVVFA